jgi:hypothetical protein
MGSNVRPRILGSLIVGRVLPSTTILSCVLTSLVHVVKKVDVDFSGDNWKFLLLNHVCRVFR